jgi:serine protease Do
MVTDVPPGPAEDAGMLAGDVLLTFDGVDVPDTRDLVRMVGNAPVGKEVIMDVLREGEMITLTVVLGRREDAEAAVPASAEEPVEPEVTSLLGLTLSEITPELAEEYGITATEGLVVTAVEPLTDAEAKGILPGDLITEAGQQPVVSIDDFATRIGDASAAGRKSLLLLVRRGGDPRFVALVLDE